MLSKEKNKQLTNKRAQQSCSKSEMRQKFINLCNAVSSAVHLATVTWLPAHPLVAFTRYFLCRAVCGWTSLLSVKCLSCLELDDQKMEMVTWRLCVFRAVLCKQSDMSRCQQQECLENWLSDLSHFIGS